jgi:hypothetical protein
MSIANGPIAVSRPSTIALRTNGVFMTSRENVAFAIALARTASRDFRDRDLRISFAALPDQGVNGRAR